MDRKLIFKRMVYLFLILALIMSATANTFSEELPMRLDVPTFAQYYEPWKDQQYGFGDRTIEYAGCALTSLSMLLKYHGVDTNPEDLNNWLKSNGGFVGKESISWAKAAQKSGGSVSYVGTTDFPGKADLSVIKNEIDKGYPVISKMSYKSTNHYVLICGYNGDTFYINDPWTEDSSKTINEGYEPYNNPAESIKGIVLFRSTNLTPSKVPVVKTAVSKFEKPIYDNFLPVIKFDNIVLTIGDPQMTVGERRINIDADGVTSPILLDNRTYLPLRATIESMGGVVNWDGTSKKIEIEIGKRTIEMWIDKRQAFINGFPFPLENAPRMVNSKTMIPIRPIIERLMCKIYWDGEKNAITITSK